MKAPSKSNAEAREQRQRWAVYRLQLQADSGNFWIKTSATSEQAARAMVMAAEECPERAILKVQRVKYFAN